MREICEQFRRAHIHVDLALAHPPSLDEPVTLILDESARPAATPAPSGPVVEGPPPLPRRGKLARRGRASIADIIAAVQEATVQVFTEGGGGSGVIVDPDGLILTSRHVVDSETGLSEREVRVDLWDGSHETATVVRSHRVLDYALLVIPRRKLLAVPIGDSLRLREAETVYVVGSPGGLTNSVSRGIVSAARRRCTTNVEYIQTDAAINPGNSGGPVVTEQGDLIGISTWTYVGDQPRAAHGLNFVIPVDYVVDDIQFLRRIGLTEACRRPYCRHCGWLHAAAPRYCECCGALLAGAGPEGSAP